MAQLLPFSTGRPIRSMTSLDLTRMMVRDPLRVQKFIPVKSNENSDFSMRSLMSQGKSTERVEYLEEFGCEITERKDQSCYLFYKKILLDFAKKSNKLAFLVNIHQIDSFKSTLKSPHFNIDFVGDFISYHPYNQFNPLKNQRKGSRYLARQHFDLVVNCEDDKEFWKFQFEFPVEEGVNVILTHPRWTNLLFSGLSYQQWKGCVGEAGFWSECGERMKTPLSPPEVILLPYYMADFESCRINGPEFNFPSEKKQISLKYQNETLEVVKKSLDIIEKTNWFTEQVPIWVLHTHHTDYDGPVIDPEYETELVLPCSAQSVFNWILSGDVKNKKVILKDSKGNKYGKLKGTSYILDQEMNEQYPQIETVVFYCNHSNSSSPHHSNKYLKWLKKHHPEKKQKVRVLDGGMLEAIQSARKLGKALYNQVISSPSFEYSVRHDPDNLDQ